MKDNLDKRKIILKCIPVMVCSIILSIILIFTVKVKLELDIRNNIEEVNRQAAKSIQYKLNSQLEQLKGLSTKIQNEEDEFIRYEIMENIHEFRESTLFGALHIINKGGYTTCEDTAIYLGDREYIKKALVGESSISSLIESKNINKNEESIMFTVPIEIDGEIVGVIEGLYKLENIKKLLSTRIYSNDETNRESKILLFDKDYNLIASNVSNNYIRTIKGRTDELIKRKNMHVVYTNLLEAGSWNLITITPKDLASENSYNIIKMLIILTILWNFILFAVKFRSVKKDYIYNENLKNMAFKDKLTGIDNYDKFRIDVDNMLKKSNDKFMIICFDIKRFKFLNKVFGYSVGDEVLRQIAKNIPKYIKGTYKYTRINNDLFAIAKKIEPEDFNIEEIVKIIRESIIVDGIYNNIIKSNDIKIDSAIGIYFIKDNSESIKTMVDYADLARIKSKELRMTTYYIFDKQILEEKEEIINIEKNIRKGLKYNEFKVYYQPKVCVKTNKIVGAEALIRWIREDGTLISPDKFIPISEKNGSINLIDKWVLIQVCKDLDRWKSLGYTLIPISINISRVEFYKSDLISFIKSTLEKYNINPELIEIEITETTALNDVDYINNKIRRIKELGLKVSMDDFGTGNSTLSNLKYITIDTLKIDRSLSIDIDKNNKSKHMIKMIIDLAKMLGHKVVCEGIESLEQVEILKDMDCDMIQGFVFYRPMDSANIEKIIKEL